MKKTRTAKILSAIYNEFVVGDRMTVREKLLLMLNILSGAFTKINLTFDSRASATFTKMERSKKARRILLGGGTIREMLGLPEHFSDKEAVKVFFPNIVKMYFALFYHEIAHNLFTDMLCDDIVNYPKPEYRNALHSFMNIVEDVYIEWAIATLFDAKYPRMINPRVYFNVYLEKYFKPMAEEYKDTKNAAGFFAYLLCFMRCGRKIMKEGCEAYDKRKAILDSKIQNLLTIHDPTTRFKEEIKVMEWIIENIPEIDFKKTPEPETVPHIGDPGDGPTIPVPGLPKGKSPRKVEGEAPGGKFGKKGKGDSIHGEAGTDKEDEPEEEDEPKDEEEETPEEEDADGDEAIDPDDSPELDDSIDAVFNDDIRDGDDHEFVVAKDEYQIKDEKLIDTINEKIERFVGPIRDVSKFLQLFKARKKPKLTSGFLTGKLDLRRAMQNELREGCDLKLFKKKIVRSQGVDLAVSLLCDESGSMCGTKSHICSTAALVLAQACEWANVPFECNAFTKTQDSMSGTCVTVKEKTFEDEFEKAKPYFALNDSDLIDYLHSERDIPTFRGNSEEINLYYIWKQLLKAPHKSKVLFVMCDGCTTGSTSDLKKIIRMIEDSGIVVIGIGIMCRDVADIYPTHKLFNSIGELESGLAPYLVECLQHYASK